MKRSSVIFLVIYIYTILAVLYFLNEDSIDPKSGSFNLMWIIYNLSSAVIINYHIDIFLVFLPILYFWYKDFIKQRVNAFLVVLVWLYMVPNILLMFDIGMSNDSPQDIFLSKEVELMAVVLKVLSSLVISLLSIFKLLNSKYKISYKPYTFE